MIMKKQLILITTLIINTFFFTALFTVLFTALVTVPTTAPATAHAASSDIYPQDVSKSIALREDLPSYVFEYDLERLYPATWEFYKKLDIIKRDKVYSDYLYHPAIKDVRHKIFKLALAADKGKTTPAPTSLNQVLEKNKKMQASQARIQAFANNTSSPLGSLNLSSVHSVTNSPAIGTIEFNTNTNQSVYSFLNNK